jgi:hypothetical protein
MGGQREGMRERAECAFIKPAAATTRLRPPTRRVATGPAGRESARGSLGGPLAGDETAQHRQPCTVRPPPARADSTARRHRAGITGAGPTTCRPRRLTRTGVYTTIASVQPRPPDLCGRAFLIPAGSGRPQIPAGRVGPGRRAE